MPEPVFAPEGISPDQWERRARCKSYDDGAKTREVLEGYVPDWYRTAARPLRASPNIVEVLTEEGELEAINTKLESQYRKRSEGNVVGEVDAEIARLERRAALIIRTKATSTLAPLEESLAAATWAARELLQRNK